MTTTGIRRTGTVLTLLGLSGLILVYAMSFFWVGTDFLQGIAQRIFYVHVPAAWTCFLAFGIAALTSGMYLWLRDDRLDRAALCAAEGGMVFGTTGIELRGSQFIRWAEAEFDLDLAEAAIALRRASFIAMGRARNLDEAPSASVYMSLTKGSCHSFTPGIAERAMRVKGTTHEFTHAPERLLADAL